MPTYPNPYRQGLDRNAANHVPLTPMSLVDWVADVYPERCAVIHGRCAATGERCASGRAGWPARWSRCDIGDGDTVAVVLPNTPPMIEAHFGVPMTRRGAELHQHPARCGDGRVHPEALRFQGADHRPRVLAGRRRGAGRSCAPRARPVPFVIDVDDPEYDRPRRARRHRSSTRPSSPRGDPDLRRALSGGRVGRDRPELHLGHHRQPEGRGRAPPRRLPERDRQRASPGTCRGTRSTCGRCRCSTATAGASRGRCRRWRAPTSACARSTPALIFALVREHRVTHYCGAPIVHSTLINAPIRR